LLKAEILNAKCHCTTLDKAATQAPQFFSEYPHFLSRRDFAQMAEFIRGYEAFLRENFSPAPSQKGLFNSYDFHISDAGPQLIEINTNAAGAILSLAAEEKVAACCTGVDANQFSREKIVAMFREEFALMRPGQTLKSVAIVDENPREQFFFHEFELMRSLLAEQGIHALIVGPEEIEVKNGVALTRSIPIDLIYNRMTDFYFEQPISRVLKQIYDAELAVVSPNPALHAFYARKSNLIQIREGKFDRAPGIDLLRAHIPETVFVTAENRDLLWHSRKQWFFKPVSGFGGKAVYRGDKMTQKVWSEIMERGYLAQRIVAPGLRQIKQDTALKYDIRVYTFGDSILGLAARYYQGQTTNFRTEHGGLALVMLAA